MNSKEGDHLIVARDYFPNSVAWVNKREEWKAFVKTWERLEEQVKKVGFSFDPRFNSVFWAYSLANLCKEIVFGFCWAEAWADFYKKKITEGSMPSNAVMQVSFYAGNCITMIDSCRDKLALMVWAYFCPFNPNEKEEILIYEGVLERLLAPVKFGLKLEGHQEFIEYLEKIKGDDFKRIEKYRHLKVHRMEPQIEMYQTGPHQEIPYLVPLTTSESIQKFKDRLKEKYPDPDFRETIFERCKIEGVPFSTIPVKHQLWEYKTIRKHIEKCMLGLLEATAGCWNELLKRQPLLK